MPPERKISPIGEIVIPQLILKPLISFNLKPQLADWSELIESPRQPGQTVIAMPGMEVLLEQAADPAGLYPTASLPATRPPAAPAAR